MISKEQVLQLHKLLIERYGGIHGVRDSGILESALARPFQTFANTDLYPSAIEKAGAILESIVKNHPFLDGNKRTGYVVMRLFLISRGLDITAREDEKYKLVIEAAAGHKNHEAIVQWLKRNTQPIESFG